MAGITYMLVSYSVKERSPPLPPVLFVAGSNSAEKSVVFQMNHSRFEG
jgi:hypothetical protein